MAGPTVAALLQVVLSALKRVLVLARMKMKTKMVVMGRTDARHHSTQASRVTHEARMLSKPRVTRTRESAIQTSTYLLA